MQLGRGTTRFGGLPDLCIFECRDCGERHIEEADIDAHSLDGGKKNCDDVRAFSVVTPGIRQPFGGFDNKLSIECLALRVALADSIAGSIYLQVWTFHG